jgi:hypothetical protein
VGPRAALDILEKRKILLPSHDLIPRTLQSVAQSAYQVHYPIFILQFSSSVTLAVVWLLVDHPQIFIMHKVCTVLCCSSR